jgi:hypothetical protein
MKNSIQAKKRNAKGPTPAKPAPLVQSSKKHWALLALCLVVACAGTWAIMEYVVWNRLPGELVGAWVVVEGPPEYHEAVFEFHRNGKMVGHLNDRENLRVMNAEVRVEADQLFITTRRPTTGEEMTVVQQIRTLNATSLVVEDERGRRLSMKRAIR